MAVFAFHGVDGDYSKVSGEAHEALLDWLYAHRQEIWVTTLQDALDWAKDLPEEMMFHLREEGHFTNCGRAAPSVGEGQPDVRPFSSGGCITARPARDPAPDLAPRRAGLARQGSASAVAGARDHERHLGLRARVRVVSGPRKSSLRQPVFIAAVDRGRSLAPTASRSWRLCPPTAATRMPRFSTAISKTFAAVGPFACPSPIIAIRSLRMPIFGLSWSNHFFLSMHRSGCVACGTASQAEIRVSFCTSGRSGMASTLRVRRVICGPVSPGKRVRTYGMPAAWGLSFARGRAWKMCDFFTKCTFAFASQNIGYWPSLSPCSRIFRRCFRETIMLTVLVAERDGEHLAAIFLLQWQDVLYYKFNASFDQSSRPNDLLLWRAMLFGRRLGMAMLDLGLSDLEQPGLVRYKRKFATEERDISFFEWLPKDIHDPRAEEASETLGHVTRLLTDPSVPDEITRAAGERFYRFFA